MTTDDKSIFRKKALERLTTPESLDEMVQVIDPKGWLVLIAIIGLLVVAIVWSIFGSIPTRISGTCLLAASGGVYEVTSSEHGQISDVSVVSGSHVEAGDSMARVEQSTKLGDIFLKKQTLLHEKEVLKEAQKLYDNTSKSIQKQLAILRKSSLNPTNTRADLQIASLEKELEKEKINMLSLQHKVTFLEEEVKLLQERYEAGNVIRAPFSGRILDVVANKGDSMSAGSLIATMELSGKSTHALEAVIYVPTAEGKKIRLGMPTNISPSTVKSEEYGMMLGNVSFVSPYPTTVRAMAKKLGSKNLAASLSKSGPMTEVIAQLKRAPDNESGFEWTSKDGPPTKIESGTICQALITEKRERPISLVIPALKHLLK